MDNLGNIEIVHNNLASIKASEEKDCTERHKFTWTIEGFKNFSLSPEALEQHQFTFEVGNKVGLPTNWKCGLWCNKIKNKDWSFDCNIKFTLDDQNVLLSNRGTSRALLMQANVKCGQESIGTLVPTQIKDLSGKSIKIGQFEKTKDLCDENGSLCLDISVDLINTTRISTSGKSAVLLLLMVQFETTFSTKLQQDMGNMYENLGSDSAVSPGMITVISSDSQRFTVDRAILAARSPVFSSMFQTPMLETAKGEVNVEDISGPAMNALLAFIHTGTLPENWQDAEIIEEFTYGAHKYMLEDLQEFLEKVVGLLSTENNSEDLEKLENLFRVNQANAEVGFVKDFLDQLNIG